MSAASLLPHTRNLTREEAALRARLLSVAHYDIALDLTDGAGGPGQGTFRCRTEIEFHCAEPGATSSIEIAAAVIHAAVLNGTPVDTTEWSAQRGLVLPGLAARNRLVIDAEFAYSSTGQGMHRSVDPVDGEVYLYTHFEPCAAQRVFPCFDQPDLKAEFTWHATVPAQWSVISNMPADTGAAENGGTENGGTKGGGTKGGGADGGTVRSVHFGRTPRMSTYLTALCAGPYHRVAEEHDGIELGLYCRRSMAGHLDADEFLEITRQGFDFFHAQFKVRYPLTKYDQLLVPDYNTGAMENLGAVTYSEERYLFRSQVTEVERAQRAGTILHEMAHIWFGDLVTMYWWDDLWLKESFATWASFWAIGEGATRFTDAWTIFLATRKAWAYQQDQLSSTHPVYADVPDLATALVNFDGITYAKGASFIKQLAAYVGVEEFVAGLRDYFTTHLWGNADFTDLIRALEGACGRELGELTTQWLRTAQVNTLRPELEVDGDGGYRAVAIRQEAPERYPTLRTHRVALGRYQRRGERLIREQRWEVEVRGELTGLPELAGVHAGDLLLLNDDDLTYAKIRLDERSLATVRDQLWRIDSVTARAICWNTLWDLVRDTELPAGDYLEVALRNLPRESHIVLLTTALARAGQALTEYTDPGRAGQGWRALARQAATSLAAATVGSGQQLIWARAYASAARETEDLATLRGWLAGREVPPGLTLDAGLRWHLLQSLAAVGAAGATEIEDELARDATAGGATEATTARALIATPHAKEAAWARLTGPEELPNWAARALAKGFQHPAQVPLTTPYARRFFADADLLWQRRGAEVCQWVVPLVYPGQQVSPEVVAASEEWLAEPDHPAPLRRLVAEGRDRVVRALAARARDAGWAGQST